MGNLTLKEEVTRQKRLQELNDQLVMRVEEDFSTTDSSHGISNEVVEIHADKVFFHVFSDEDRSLALGGKRILGSYGRSGSLGVPKGHSR